MAAQGREEEVSRGPGASRVQSVERAAALLGAIGDMPEGRATVSRLAEACGLNRATAWRILQTLEEHRLVALQRATGQYSIGPAVVELARSSGLEELVRSARPVLEDLAGQAGETAALAVRHGPSLRYVDEVTPTAVVAATWRGREVPLHATSTGKVVLAFSPPGGDIPAGSSLTAYTPRTITRVDELDRELDRVRRTGYAVCRGEYESSAYGVSAPVLGPGGDLQAVLSLWGPAGRLTEERFPQLGDLAVRAAERLRADRDRARAGGLSPGD